MASGLKTVIRIEWLMTVARDCLWATSFAAALGQMVPVTQRKTRKHSTAAAACSTRLLKWCPQAAPWKS